MAVDASDPHAGSTGNPSTRVPLCPSCTSLTDALQTLSEKYLETAGEWEKELDRGNYRPGKWPAGKGNIQNWINWLRGCAEDLDRILRSLQEGPRT